MFTSTFFCLLILYCACSFAQDSDEFLDLTLSESYLSGPAIAVMLSAGNSCPENLDASWLLTPPFVTMPSRSGSRNGSDVQIGGILHEVLDLSLRKCCAILNKTGNKTAIKYKFQAADNRSMLHKDILHKEADLILPVQSDDKDKYNSYLPYLKILESPGIALIQRSDSQYWGSKNILLWNAISSCWPIVVLTLLLSLIAGMCVWAMETKENTQEFDSPFYRGAFDGFWWAFVTMSTVGQHYVVMSSPLQKNLRGMPDVRPKIHRPIDDKKSRRKTVLGSVLLPNRLCSFNGNIKRLMDSRGNSMFLNSNIMAR